MIGQQWEQELFAYISGIVENCQGRLLAINGIADHIHLLVRLGANMAFADFMRELKAGSSRWIRQRHNPKFSWQRRYGAFTVSESAAGTVKKYIQNQKAHHGVQTFEGEYIGLLKKHGVEFDARYLWS